jgi:hypothetical protein
VMQAHLPYLQSRISEQYPVISDQIRPAVNGLG